MKFTHNRKLAFLLVLLVLLSLAVLGCAEEPGTSHKEASSGSAGTTQTIADACAVFEAPYREGELIIAALTSPLDMQASQQQGPAMDDDPQPDHGDKEPTTTVTPEDLKQQFLQNPQINFEVFLKTYDEETVNTSLTDLSNSVEDKQAEIFEPQVLKSIDNFSVSTKRMSEAAQTVYESPTAYDKQTVVAAVESFIDSFDEVATLCDFS